jgi:ribosomal protein S18 acetylase RimI-like enzyme
MLTIFLRDQIMTLRAGDDREICYRAGRAADAPVLARLMNLASAGASQYALQNLVPGVPAEELLARAVARSDSEFSHTRCLVAADSVRILGMINFFTPAERDQLSQNSLLVMPPPARIEFLRRVEKLWPFAELQISDSIVIDTIAVETSERGQGIGAALMNHAKQAARNRGLSQLSVQVWEDNLRGLAFYQREGFQLVKTIAFTPPPPIASRGGLCLLACPV